METYLDGEPRDRIDNDNFGMTFPKMSEQDWKRLEAHNQERIRRKQQEWKELFENQEGK